MTNADLTPELCGGSGLDRECLGFVEEMPMLEAVKELADELVEQVPCRCGVSVAVFSSASVVLASGFTMRGSSEGPDPPGRCKPVVLDAAVSDRNRLPGGSSDGC